MGTRGKRPRRIRRHEAERLLDGGSVAGGPVDAGRLELARVLAAVSGPALPEEVADEEAAAALFGRQYELGRTARASSRYALPRPASPRAVAFRLAVTLGVLLSGGLAASAETGILPAALQRPAHALFSPFGVPPAGTGPARTGQPRHSTAPSAGAAGTGPPGAAGSAPPYPDEAIGWCREYENGKGKLKTKNLADLSAAAGGTAKIPGFCAAVLGAAASGRPGAAGTPQPTDHPAHPSKPAKSHKPKPTHK
ncbi:MAG: hypothetical protein V7603_4731 [Micromonosporaceae bacterium]